jgi:hypothetical protein
MPVLFAVSGASQDLSTSTALGPHRPEARAGVGKSGRLRCPTFPPSTVANASTCVMPMAHRPPHDAVDSRSRPLLAPSIPAPWRNATGAPHAIVRIAFVATKIHLDNVIIWITMYSL